MNVHEIVKDWLEKYGYDGLRGPFGECACEIDDLMPCHGIMWAADSQAECEPGYKVPCDCGEGCGYHIVSTKAEVNDATE